jgi:hypothetical protein
MEFSLSALFAAGSRQTPRNPLFGRSLWHFYGTAINRCSFRGRRDQEPALRVPAGQVFEFAGGYGSRRAGSVLDEPSRQLLGIQSPDGLLDGSVIVEVDVSLRELRRDGLGWPPGGLVVVRLVELREAPLVRATRSDPCNWLTWTRSPRSTSRCGARRTYPSCQLTTLANLDQEQFASSWRGRLEGQPFAKVRQLVGLSPDGPFVATGSAEPSRDEDAPTAWELFAINVLAAAHGTGLADLMMADLVGDRPTSLWVLDGNQRARAFYARYGFVPHGATKEHEPSGRVKLRLVRN